MTLFKAALHFQRHAWGKEIIDRLLAHGALVNETDVSRNFQASGIKRKKKCFFESLLSYWFYLIISGQNDINQFFIEPYHPY